jgi:hypothetical protein
VKNSKNVRTYPNFQIGNTQKGTLTKLSTLRTNLDELLIGEKKMYKVRE